MYLSSILIILFLIIIIGLLSIIFFQRHLIIIILYFEVISLCIAICFVITATLTNEIAYSYALVVLSISTAETVIGFIISLHVFKLHKQLNITTYKKLKY